MSPKSAKSDKAKEVDCVFCLIIAGRLPARVIYEDEQAIAFLDIAAWHRGHTLVVTKEHVTDLVSGEPSLVKIAPAVDAVSRMLLHRLAADGINVLSSAREAAGQTVFHMHMHVVPRYADEPGLGLLVNPVEVPEGELKSVYRQIQANA